MTVHRSFLPLAFFPILLGTLLSCNREAGSDGADVESIALDVPAEAAAFVPVLDGPLRPISVSPSGSLLALQPGQVVAVTFSQPMVPVGEAPAPPAGQLSLSPSVAGTLRWEGTQTLVFQPEQTLPLATAFTATLQAGLTSIDGDRLDAPYTWTFETPRPTVVSATPYSGQPDVSPEAAVFLRFSQPLDTARVADFLTFQRIPEQRPVPFDLGFEGDTVAVLRPRIALQKGIHYAVNVAAGLPDRAGPLGSARPYALPFSVHPELAFVDVGQHERYPEEEAYVYDEETGEAYGVDPSAEQSEGFDPSTSVSVTFSTSVRFEALRKAIRITPPAPMPAGIETRDASVSSIHTLPVHWAPETDYIIAFDSLVDMHGQVLAHAERRFRTRAYTPVGRMPRGVLVIEAGEQPFLPLFATNIDRVSYGLTRIAPEQVIPSLPSYEHWRTHALIGIQALPAVPAANQRILSLARNVPSVWPFDLGEGLTNGTGIVGVQLHGPVRPGRKEPAIYRALAQVTRMGIAAKFSPHQNLFFVTELATSAPVADAAVTLRGADNKVYWQGTTDATGRAQGPGWHVLGMPRTEEWEQAGQYVFVEKNGDVAFTSSRFDDGLEPYRFGIYNAWSVDPIARTGLVFTDRGLYREGETVHLKGIIRQKTDGEWQPIQDSVYVQITSPREEIVYHAAFLPGEWGTFDFEWEAPEGATLGSYFVSVKETDDEDDYRYIATGYFRVDAFRRATFSVDVQPGTGAYVAGDFFEASVSGHYLFGAAMQGQPVRYGLARFRTYYAPPGYDGYVFSSWRSQYYDVYASLASGDSLLDADGRFALRATLPGNAQGVPATVSLSAVVTDPARQESAGRADVLLHPGLFYIGLKPKTTFLDLSRERRMDVDAITVDPNGRPVPVSSFTLTLVREQWNSVREVGEDGRMRWRTDRVEEVKRTLTLGTEAGKARRLSFAVEEGGSYIVRAEARDLRGNAVQSEAHFYATGSGYVAWQRSDDDRIELVPERTRYRPGETARFLVQSPFEEATALITVEREGILSSEVTTLRGSAPRIEIPLTEAHLPNVYVSVMLIQGRTAPPSGSSDPGAPTFKIGYAAIDVETDSRRLAVEIVPNETTYRPGDEVTVDLRLLDARGDGVAGEVAFSAADAGVLNIIGYALPDPFDTFYGSRPLGVATTQTLSSLIRQRNYGQKEEDAGGGGGMEDASRTRKDFRPLAHWDPAIRTDARGRARVTFKLPESLTTFRLMASALSTGNRYGASSTDIIVTKPLVMTPALPRFARLGDRFEAGVLITNTTGTDGDVVVLAQASGIGLDASEQTLRLAHGETREVRFAWEGTVAGAATLTFSARLGRERDALEVPLEVERPTIKYTQATFASTEDGAGEALQLPGNLIPELGGFEAKLASTALVGLEGAARYLFDYPYGCLEQQTSRIRPLIAGDALLDVFDLDVLGGSRDQAIRAWTNELRSFWMGDGFALWKGGYIASEYTTAYVVLALAEARDAGFPIPEDLTRDAVEALSRWANAPSTRPEYLPERYWNDTRALLLYALSRHGRFLDQQINALVTGVLDQSQPMSMDGRSHLLRLLVRRNAPLFQAQKQRLIDSIVQAIRVESTSAYLTASQEPGAGWVFASDTRTTAFGLTALIETRPPEETRLLVERMIRYLIETRQGDHWASTQENAAVVEAFSLYQQQYESETPDFVAEVRLAGRSILRSTFRGRSLSSQDTLHTLAGLPAAEILPVEIEKQGTGRLYYTLRLESYTSNSVPALAQGLSVERRLQRIDASGAAIGPADVSGGRTLSLGSGDLVRVTIRLTSPVDRHYIVVDDALPAGLEPLNEAFLTTDRSFTEDTGSERWWGSFNHTEKRDDRVLLFADYLTRGEHTYTYVARATTPGTFVHPPAQAEAMYQPEINGRNASGTLEVRAQPDPLARN